MRGTGAERPESAARYLELADRPITRVIDLLLPLGQGVRVPLVVASWLLALAALWACRRSNVAPLILSIWLGFGAYAAALTFVTILLPRYLAPLDALLWVANAVAIVALSDRAWHYRRRGRLPRVTEED